VIRANLLPRPKQKLAVFGFELDAEYVRQSLAGLGLAALVAGIGFGIERVRIDRGAAQLRELQAAVAQRAPERTVAGRLALEVARYQEFEREADIVRGSGADAALDVARIGNAVPDSVWLDALERDPTGYAVSGKSLALGGVANAMLGLSDARSDARVELVSMDAHAPDGREIRFTAHVALAAPAGPAK
jgi:hypothetical protein